MSKVAESTRVALKQTKKRFVEEKQKLEDYMILLMFSNAWV